MAEADGHGLADGHAVGIEGDRPGEGLDRAARDRQEARSLQGHGADLVEIAPLTVSGWSTTLTVPKGKIA